MIFLFIYLFESVLKVIFEVRHTPVRHFPTCNLMHNNFYCSVEVDCAGDLMVVFMIAGGPCTQVLKFVWSNYVLNVTVSALCFSILYQFLRQNIHA